MRAQDPKSALALEASIRGPQLEAYRQEPSFESLSTGGAALERGHAGETVRLLQMLLNALGADPPLAVDGLFGPLTQGAVRQLGVGSAESGRVDGALLVDLLLNGCARRRSEPVSPRSPAGGARRAPRYGERPPSGTVSAGSLQRADEARRSGGPAGPRGTSAGPVQGAAPAPGQTPADAELARLQQGAVESARQELAQGVRDDGHNRSPRVDQYARDGGMPVGGAWCGYFTGFNYNQAARGAGGRFRENIRFHSFQKARAYFEYRSYTNNSRGENERLDRLREQHQGEGSTRRWMVLSGSGGEQHARTHQRPHEVYEPGNLPIRAGDTALFSRGHVGLVESYDAGTGRLVTIEGNSSGGRVMRHEYDLNNPEHRARFDGFGRPARGDFELPGQPPPREAEPQAPAGGDGAPTAPRAQAGEAPPAREDGAPGVAARPAGEVGRPEVSTRPAGRLDLPARSAGAMTGSQFLQATRHLSRAEREAAILREIEQGNVPEFARQMREIQVEGRGPDGQLHRGKLRVMPDYLAIGSDSDFVRIPMTPATAQAIADRTGTSLPTRRIVDRVFQQADVRLDPRAMPVGAAMMSNGHYGRHNELIEAQREGRGAPLGALTVGHKKDLVIGNALTDHPDRVAIYGWHYPNGRPIQGLSWIHEASYADYSHGVRLVGGSMEVDGVERPLAEVLQDPSLAYLVSDEGPLRDPRVPRRR